jgi:hypothetical protein
MSHDNASLTEQVNTSPPATIKAAGRKSSWQQSNHAEAEITETDPSANMLLD